MKLIASGDLVSLSREGVYVRLRSTFSVLTSLFLTPIAIVFAMVAKLCPPDVRYLVFEKISEKNP